MASRALEKEDRDVTWSAIVDVRIACFPLEVKLTGGEWFRSPRAIGYDLGLERRSFRLPGKSSSTNENP